MPRWAVNHKCASRGRRQWFSFISISSSYHNLFVLFSHRPTIKVYDDLLRSGEMCRSPPPPPPPPPQQLCQGWSICILPSLRKQLSRFLLGIVNKKIDKSAIQNYSCVLICHVFSILISTTFGISWKTRASSKVNSSTTYGANLNLKIENNSWMWWSSLIWYVLLQVMKNDRRDQREDTWNPYHIPQHQYIAGSISYHHCSSLGMWNKSQI